MRTALLVIATGKKYHPFIAPLLASARRYFVHHIPFLWTDDLEHHYPAQQFFHKDEGFPGASLHRYRTVLSQKKLLRNFAMTFHVDADMLFVAPVKEEDIYSEGITAVLHAGFVGQKGAPERRPWSTACLPASLDNRYYLGGFVGGKTEAYLHMAEVLAANIESDEQNEVEAVWHDESHLQRYLYEHPPARILPPSFGFPETIENINGWNPKDYPPVLMALEKPRD
jgi:Glycosyltransferase family 6